MSADRGQVELVLRKVEALPTLPAVAARLLALTSSDDASTREVVRLVSSDPALTARVLAMCRSAARGVRGEVATVERAVVLLGFGAVRAAVLSVQVLDWSRRLAEARQPGDDAAAGLDLQAFWLHCLAVASAAEVLASDLGDAAIRPDEAFVAGLLHDVGKLALDAALPRAHAKAVEVARQHAAPLDEVERRVLGIDHPTAGKRLAERWGLPHRLQDAIWLHASPFESLPGVEHRRLVGLVRLANTVARGLYIGGSGNASPPPPAEAMAATLGLSASAVERCRCELHERVEERSRALGLDTPPTRQLLSDSLQQANAALARTNEALERRGRAAQRHAATLSAVAAFHASAGAGQSQQDVLDRVGLSAATALGEGFLAIVAPVRHSGGEAVSTLDTAGEAWSLSRYGQGGEPVHWQHVPAAEGVDLRRLDESSSAGVLAGLVVWACGWLGGEVEPRRLRVLPLPCGWGTAAVVLHDRDTLPDEASMAALRATWGAAVASASQHEGVRRLSEELAGLNAALASAQERAARHEAMARLGEVAAGAAHEMNNPLAVISGQSQLLAQRVTPGSQEHRAAKTLTRAAQSLSDLIGGLHLFAHPPQPVVERCELGPLLDEVIRSTQGEQSGRDEAVELSLRVGENLPAVCLDRGQIVRAMRELMLNALQAPGRRSVEIVARHDPATRRVQLRVTDDGGGMDPHTLHHATDPFFSAKKAGRRCGLGLPTAKRLIEAHGGTLELRSVPHRGTSVTVTLPIRCGNETAGAIEETEHEPRAAA